MPLAKTAYTILGHFKFETGSAVASVNKLSGSLNKMTEGLKSTERNFKVLFASHTLSLTGGVGGIAGTLHKMVTASEDYYQIQRKLSTIMVSNSKKQMDFNMAMRTSGVILRDLAKDAQRLALPIEEYTSVFSELAGPMVAKGVAGRNMKNTRNLAKNFMMMSQVFPIQPWQIHNVLSGAITNQNPLFRILKDDTQEFKNMSLGRWRGMKYGRKVESLNRAFGQYSANNPEIIGSQIRSLQGQLTILQNFFTSITSVLKPLGDVIRGPLVRGLIEVNKWIGEKLRQSLQILADTLKPLTGNLASLYVEFEKLKALSGTLSKSGVASGIAFMVVELKKFVPMILRFAVALGLLGGRGTLAAGAGLAALLKWMLRVKTVGQAVGKVMMFLASSLKTYLAFFLPLTALFRVIDSARAQAKVADMKRYAEELPNVTKKATDVARAFVAIQAPFSMLINFIGKQIAFLFQRTWWVEQAYRVLQKFDIGKAVRNLTGGLVYAYTAFEQTLITVIQQLIKLFTNPKNLLSPSLVSSYQSFMDAYLKNLDKAVKPRWDAMDKHFDKYMKSAGKPPAPIYNNYGKVEIRNQFPENLEPDRIAVSIKESFVKSVQAQVDTSRRMQTFSPTSGYGP